MQKEVYLIYYGVVRSKKNSKRIIRNHRTGQMGLISSKEAKENEDDMVKQFKARAPRDIISSPVKIKIEMFEPNRTRRDLDNQATSILDALVKAGIIKDDGISHVVEVNVRFAGVSKQNPRAVIRIESKEFDSRAHDD